MEVDDGLAGEVEDVIAQDLAVGHDDDDIGCECCEVTGDVADFDWLQHGDAGMDGGDFDRGWGKGLVATDGFIGLGDQGEWAWSVF